MLREDLNQNERLGDIVDQVDLQQQRLLDAKIKEITDQKIDMSNPTQACWHCGEQTQSEQHRWCSPSCRDDWQADND